jgi:Bacterial Ig domain/Protein of unknown function (DUF1565)
MVDRSRWQRFAIATRTVSGLGRLAIVAVVVLIFAPLGHSQAFAASPIHIASPAPDATVSNSVTTSVKIKPDVARVAFLLDGTLLSSSSSTSFVWNSTVVPNGTHTISAQAYSSSNQLLRTVSEKVKVHNHTPTPTPTPTAPPVSFVSPTNGQKVSGTITVALSFSTPPSTTNPDAVWWTQLSVDGTTITDGYNNLPWTTTTVANGSHSLRIDGYAYNGTTSIGSSTISVTVSNTDATSTPTMTPTGTSSSTAKPTPTSSSTPTAGFVTLLSPSQMISSLTGSTAGMQAAGIPGNYSAVSGGTYTGGISTPSSAAGPGGLPIMGYPLLTDQQAASLVQLTPRTTAELGTGCPDGTGTCGTAAQQQASDYYYQTQASTPSGQTAYLNNLAAYQSTQTSVPAAVAARVDGACPFVNPTLAEVAQWGAYKWGIDPIFPYAETENDGNWDAVAYGDCGGGTCTSANQTSIGPWQVADEGSNYGWSGLISGGGNTLVKSSVCFQIDFYMMTRWWTYYSGFIIETANEQNLADTVASYDTGGPPPYTGDALTYQEAVYSSLTNDSWVSRAFGGTTIPIQVPNGTVIPAPAPTSALTTAPTPAPTTSLTPDPTTSLTPDPTTSLTPDPTTSPTPDPTSSPTPAPTAIPTSKPTVTSTAAPTATPNSSAFYVSPTGSDSAAGSSSAPWRTIQKAASALKAGQTAIVSAGNYGERVEIANSGTQTAPITLQVASGADVQLLGFDLSGSNWVLNGFDISTQTNGSEGYGIYVTGSASYDTIENNYIHELCHEGIFMDPTVSHISILTNRMWRAEMAGAQVDGTYELVKGNEVWGTQQEPVEAGGIYSVCETPGGADADAFRFFGQHNVFQGNNLHDIYTELPTNPNPHTDCFQTWGSTAMEVDDILIEQNFCRWPVASTTVDAETAMIEGVDGLVGTVTFQNNELSDMRQGIVVGSNVGALHVYNNTWDHVVEEGVIFNDMRSSADEFINNIYYDVGAGGDSYAEVPSGSPVFEDNDFYMPGGASLGTYPSVEPYISVAPMFVNYGDATASGADFHLQAGSPLKGAGTTLTEVVNDYYGTSRVGAAYSIGAAQ